MKNIKIASLVPLLVFAGVVTAQQHYWEVPEFRREIQQMIVYGEVDDGDTISVWGYGEPPFTYNDHLDYGGKKILVVNRSYIPNRVPYSPNPYWVQIDGSQPSAQRSVVFFHSNEDTTASIKGFTLTRGGVLNEDWFGGGILISNSSPKVEACSICGNQSTGGGGIYSTENSSPIIKGNIIVDNIGTWVGGGLCFERNSGNPTVNDNIISDNLAGSGGGVYIGTSSTKLIRNVIENNNTIGEIGGIYIVQSNCYARENVIQNNQECGIYCDYSPGNYPDFGDAVSCDPGYNVILNNWVFNHESNQKLKAKGNYWGTLHTSDIQSYIHGLGEVDFNPVAASDKWFSIGTDQFCETNVLVTGTLTVTLPEGFLTIAPGDTFWFLQKDAPPELKICGGLIAESGIENMINFLPYPFWPPPSDLIWMGITIESTAWAHFIYCKIVGAYQGIYLSNAEICGIHSCEITDNQFAGIYVKNSSLTINDCSIARNGVAGINVSIDPNQPHQPHIWGNEIFNNGIYGIEYENGPGASIDRNIITNDITPNVAFTPNYGIYLVNVGENGGIRANEITNFVQSGIGEDKSFVPIDSNYFFQNQELLKGYGYGIWCSNTSSPLVRKNKINYWKAGVYCDNNSYPDLGIEPDSGKNSILMENYYWVANFNPDLPPPPEPIEAELNWWGTDDPSRFPEKFIGFVDYDPWLTSPIEEEGGQSANIIKPTPTFALYSPKPNPASGEVKITYSLPSRCKSELIIGDVSGRIITKRTEEKDAGYYEYLWQRKTQSGRTVSNGVYIIRLKTGDNLQTQKITLVR